MSLQVRIITPDRIVWNTSAEEVVLPSTTGQLGILVNHTPLITAIEVGVLRVKIDKNWTPMVLLGGFAEIEDNQVTILVNGVEEVSTIDINEAKSALNEASEQLESANSSKEKIEASQNLKKASARLQAASFLSN